MQLKQARRIAWVALGLLCLLSSAPVARADSEPAPPTGWVQGTVEDADGLPRAGVVVRAWRDSSYMFTPPTTARAFAALFDAEAASADESTAVSAEDGSFRLEGLVLRQAYSLEAVVEPPEVSSVAFLAMAGAGMAEQRLVVEEGRLVRGRVVDLDGRGVRALVRGWSYAEVNIWGATSLVCGGSSSCATRSGEDGRFTLAAPKGQGLQLYASVPGDRMRGYFHFGPDQDDLELTLRSAGGASIEGRVLDESGAPLAGARIWARIEHRYDGGYGDWTVGMATSRADGSYRISNLQPGFVRGIAVYLPGREIISEQLNLDPVRADLPWRADFHLRATRTVRGRVVDQAGAPIAHAWVGGGPVLRSPGPKSLPGVRCDAEGRFEIAGVSTEGGSLAAWADGFHMPLKGAHLRWIGDRPGVLVSPAPAGSTAEIEICMRRSEPFAVRVRDAAGKVVAGARVTLQVWREGGARRQAPIWHNEVSGRDGRAVFRCLAPFRAASVSVNAPQLGSARIPLDLNTRGVAEIILPLRGAVTGRVLDADGAPVVGVAVHVRAGSLGNVIGSGNPYGEGEAGRTDPSGAFVLRGVPPGRCTIGLGSQPGAGPSAEVEVKPGIAVPKVVLRLVGREVISGRVLDEKGQPLSNVGVSLCAVPPVGGSKRVSSGPGGLFRFTHLPKGRYRLGLPLAGLPVGSKPSPEVEAGTQGLELRFSSRSPLLVSGYVVDPHGRPVAEADVQLAAEGDGMGATRARGKVFGGWFQVGALGPLGKPQVRILKARGSDGSYLNVLPETELLGQDEDGRLRLRLLPALSLRGRVEDESGVGLAGISLSLLPERRDATARWPQPLTTASRSDGSFAFLGLRAGSGKLSLNSSAEWKVPAARQVVMGEEHVRLRLWRWRKIAGRVLTRSGAAVTKASVHAWCPADGRRGRSSRLVRTDAQGAFEFPQVDPDLFHTLEVIPPKGDDGQHVVTLLRDVAPGTEGLRIRLSEGLTIAGRVTTQAGEPIAGALVTALRPRRPQGGTLIYHGPWHATADKEGRYVLRTLPHDTKVALEFRGPPESAVPYFLARRKDIPTGAPDVNVRLGLGHFVRGTVVGVAPLLLEGARLSLHPARGRSRGPGPRFTFDGKSNAFRFDPVQAGTWKIVFVRGSAPEVVDPAPVTVGVPGTPMRIQVERAWYVSGRVVGQDARDYRVALYRGGGKVLMTNVRDERGSFRLGPVKDEPLTLVAMHPQKPFVALLEVRRPAEGPFELQLKAGHPISGRIAGLPGKMKDGSILARRGALKFRASIAEDGWFKTPPLPPGLWQLEVVARSPRGRYKALGSVEAGSEQVVIRFTPR